MNNSTPSVENMGYAQEFKRVLSLKDLVFYGIAFMTPIAPAYMFGIISTNTGGLLATAYVFAMIAMMFTAYSYGKMAAAFPFAGSTYSYTQRSINPHLGFLAGWAMFLDYVLVPLSVFVAGANYAHAAIPAIPYWVCVLVIAGSVTAVNCFGIKLAALTNNLLVIYMGLVVVIFVVSCVRALLGGVGEATLFSTKPFFNPETFSSATLVSGVALACFSFLGFDSISTLSEEANKPEKNIGRAAILACLFGGLLFILQAYVGQMVWPDITTYPSVYTAMFDIAKAAGGTLVSSLLTSAVLVSCLSAGIAGQASAARLMFGMGRDEVLPKKFFAHLHPKYKTPTYNIFIMAAIGIAGALLIPFASIAEMMNFGGLLGFMCVNLSVFAYYYVKNKERNVLKNLILPLLGFAVCFYLWIHLSPRALIVGFSWLTIGLIYAAITTKGFKKIPPTLGDL